MKTMNRINQLIALAALAGAAGHAGAIDTRIIGGFDVDIESVPATVALINARRLDESGSLLQSQFCGGTIISDRWVLTAAHCVEDPDGNALVEADIRVLMGTTDLTNPVSDAVAISRIIQHEDWSRITTKNDIALLELRDQATQPAIRIDEREPQLQDSAFIVGWGTTEVDAEGAPIAFATTLQGAYVDFTPGDVCGQMFPVYDGVVDGSQVCVGVPEGGKGACFGDSGGPAYRVLENNFPILTGLTSFGARCAGAGTPAVYTNIFAYRDWITQHTGDLNTPVEPQANDDPTTNSSGSSGSGASWLFLPLLALVCVRARRAFTLTLSLMALAMAIPGQAIAQDDTVGVIGGDDLDIVFVPSIVALLDSKRISSSGDFTQAQFCGGSIIADRWILTAAHCVELDGDVTPADEILVWMGSSTIDNSRTPVSVDQVIVHPEWNPATLVNDMALLELSFRASQSAIALDFQPVSVGDQGYIAGWGALSVNEQNRVTDYGTELQGLYLELTPGEFCREAFPNIPQPTLAEEICVGGQQDNAGGCFGDSGGPVYRVTDTDQLVLSGVASYVTGLCGQQGHPTVYASTWAYRDFIVSNVGSDNLAVLPARNEPTNDGSNIVESGGSGGGGVTWILLPLIGGLALIRQRRVQVAALTVVTGSVLTACFAAGKLNAGDNQSLEEGSMSVSVFEQPIGMNKQEVGDSLASLWNSAPVCEIQRTGVGQLMRSYFLETCEYTNAAEQTICGFEPQSARYYFLEDKLVRVSFEFGSDGNEGYRDCVLSKGWELGFNQVAIVDTESADQSPGSVVRLSDPEENLGVIIDENNLTHVSNMEVVASIHALKGTL